MGFCIYIMAENKKSFVLYADLIKSIDHLTNEEKGILFTHLLEYVNDKNPILTDRLILTAWKPIELQLKRDLVKFEEVKAKRSDAGKRSAELRALKNDEQNSTNPTSVESVEQTATNPTVNDNVNVSVNVNDNVILLEKETKGNLSETEILPLNNQKEKEKKVAPKKEKETIETTPEFLDLWNQYKEYRVAKKKSFKFAGLKWEQQAFDKFYNLANGKIEIAKQILNQSIANNWDGLFELKEIFKQQSNGTTTTSTKQQFKFSTANAIKTITSQTE